MKEILAFRKEVIDLVKVLKARLLTYTDLRKALDVSNYVGS